VSEIDKMIKAYVKCRDHMNAVNKECKATMKLLEEEIMKHSEKTGVDSFKTKYGTAYRQENTFVKVKNWEAALDFIIDNDLRHMLPRSVKKSSVLEYRELNNNELPEGLVYGTRSVINVIRSR